MMLKEMLPLPGSRGISSALNQPRRLSRFRRERSRRIPVGGESDHQGSGKGQGWEAKYRIFSTSMPTSSRISRATVSSRVSPASTNPARDCRRRVEASVVGQQNTVLPVYSRYHRGRDSWKGNLTAGGTDPRFFMMVKLVERPAASAVAGVLMPDNQVIAKEGGPREVMVHIGKEGPERDRYKPSRYLRTLYDENRPLAVEPQTDRP